MLWIRTLDPISAPRHAGSVNTRKKAPVQDELLARALDRLRDILQRRALRMTPVREAIVRAALGRKGHFDIEDLVRDLQSEDLQEASTATVYRAIPLMVEAGLVQPTLLSSGERHRYEWSFEREHHDHLVCIECGKVVEFHFEAFEMLQQDLAARYDFELTEHVHELLGRCGSCRKKRKKAGGSE